jgi:hypothetical protein
MNDDDDDGDKIITLLRMNVDFEGSEKRDGVTELRI